jgi:glycine/D-amino acid oxidase-like deaminating enzyme
MPKILIVGAGINGLSTARALRRRGWEVEIAERGPLPNREAASFDRHKLIRSHYAGFPVYARRIAEAFAAWEELWRDLGANHYEERGILALSREKGDWSDEAARAMDLAGVPYTRLSPGSFARDFPMFSAEGLREATLTAGGGVLYADRILAGLIAWLRAAGVRFHADCPILSVDRATGRALAADRAFQADLVLVAAGIGAPALVPDLCEGFRPMRSQVLHLDPPEALKAAWARAPCWVDLGGTDEAWGMAPAGPYPIKAGAGHRDIPSDAVAGRIMRASDIAGLEAVYARSFTGFAAYRRAGAEANFFLDAPDGRFALRREGKLVFLSADSGHGFKFGALTGQDVARALTGDFDREARLLAGHEA